MLLEKPMRISTDVDILVAPETDLDGYIAKAGKIFPFLSVDEHKRVGRDNIEKRHFKFGYLSPISGGEVTILLDVVFRENPYPTLLEQKIGNELLLMEGLDTVVRVPSINCLLGDKPTAFAPHTTGIPFGISKELEADV